MRWLDKRILRFYWIAIFIGLIGHVAYAQNNAIFAGGIAEGFTQEFFLMPSSNFIFAGGAGDGFGQICALQLSNNQLFAGGNGDGFTNACFIQPSQNAIFAGASGDGFDENCFLQISSNGIFSGGSADGFSVACFAMVAQNLIFSGGDADGFDMDCFSTPFGNDIFEGGIADGYTVACFFQSSNNPIYAGGVGDGFDLFQVLQSPVFPVELLSFDGIYVDGESWLNWVTTSEINNSHFELQRSIDGTIFERIATLQGMGNSTEINGYEYIDPVAHLVNDYEVLYYRLKQVDLDGTFQLSRIVTIHLEPFQNSVYAYPNPTAETLFLRFRSAVSESIDVDVFNVQGSLIQDLHFQPEPDRKTLKLDFTSLAEGIYYCRVHFGDDAHELVSIRFVILK